MTYSMFIQPKRKTARAVSTNEHNFLSNLLLTIVLGIPSETGPLIKPDLLKLVFLCVERAFWKVPCSGVSVLVSGDT